MVSLKRWETTGLVALALIVAVLAFTRIITGNEAVVLLLPIIGAFNGTAKGKPPLENSGLDERQPKA